MRQFLAVMLAALTVSVVSFFALGQAPGTRAVMTATCYSDGTFSLQSTPKP